jgi:phospholipid/cholesterol/gamma-HCH transport system substrate-binding protein
MGNKIINITPGTSAQEEIRNNDLIVTMRPINLDEIWGQLKKTADNAQTITSDLATIVDNIRSGKGTVGKLFMDSALVMNLNQTLKHVKKGAQGFAENMDAAQHSFLLRNIFKRKQKKLERQKKQQQEEAAKKNK